MEGAYKWLEVGESGGFGGRTRKSESDVGFFYLKLIKKETINA